MEILAKIQIYCFLFCYLISLACESVLVVRRGSAFGRWTLLVCTSAGFLAHTAYLIAKSRTIGLPPLLTSQQDWLLVLAWLGSLLYLVLLITHGRLAHGLFMLPVIVLLVVVAIFVSDQASGNLREVAFRRWGMFHAASLVLGIGAVVGAALSGLMYLLHHQRLRSRSGWLQKLSLPSLEDLTTLNRWMVVCSVPCLTIGLVTGFLLILWRQSPEAAESIRWTDPTIVTTVLVWVAMIILLARLLVSPHQTGKSVAQLSLLSGGFLLVTVLGPMLLAGTGHLNTFHGRPRTIPPERVEPLQDQAGRTFSRPPFLAARAVQPQVVLFSANPKGPTDRRVGPVRPAGRRPITFFAGIGGPALAWLAGPTLGVLRQSQVTESFTGSLGKPSDPSSGDSR